MLKVEQMGWVNTELSVVANETHSTEVAVMLTPLLLFVEE
jgi:hypothetical protein